MDKKFVITIGRQYGSGGKEIGQKLATMLGVPFYDKELLTIAANKSGMCEEMFETHDEKPTNSFLYSLVMGTYSGENLPLNHKLFLAQFDTIRDIALKGPCVIIGRCADYALEDFPNCINFFIHGDLENRIQRAIKNYGDDPEKAKDIVLKTDKNRASYYNFYSGKKWGTVDNYHMTINSSALGIEKTAEVLCRFVESKIKA